MSKRSLAARANQSNAVARAASKMCEQLESRTMLSSWTELSISHSPPAAIGACMLLSDGTVLAHGQADTATKNWYKLTPDSSGSYSNGSWTTLTSSSLERLFYASNILKDGRVLVLGGEYSGPTTANTFTNTGEIYNPVTGSWSAIPNFPQSQFGDDPTQVLDNGKVLAGYLSGAQTYLYDPTANSWAASGTKLNSDRSDEETWVKLGDGSILSWDVFSQPRAQKYDQTTGTWSQAGTTPSNLTQGGSELGPGFRIPNGKVVQFGASAHNAIYDPATNTWAALLDTPGALGGNDSPGAELPNGHILFAAGDTSTAFSPPTTFFDVDPVNNTFTPLTSPTGGATMNVKPFLTSMLMLPTGQVLLTSNSTNVYVFNPDGAANDAWRSTVNNVTNNNNGTFTLTGSLLNGISEGASYGDDAEMSTNFPIVTLTNSSGGVLYARTSNWNTTGVGNDSATSTQFTLPTGIVAGAYKLNVIANGIASKDYLLVVTNSTINNVSIRVDPSNSAKVQVLNGATNLDSFVANFAEGFVVGSNAAETVNISHLFANLPIVVNASGGGDTINVNTANAPVTVNGGDGDDFINFSIDLKNLDNLNGCNAYISGGNGYDQVYAYDSNATVAKLWTITSARFDRTSWGGFYYASDIEALNALTGTAADTVNVQSTFANQPIWLNSSGGGDVVTVGNNTNGVQSIAADVNVGNSPSFTALTITDLGDTVAKTATMDFAGSSAYGEVNFLAPAHIIWKASDVSGVKVVTGSAADTVIDYASNVPVTISSSGGNDVVSLGDSAVNGAQNISSTVYVDNPGAFTTLDLDDYNDPTARTITMNYNTSTFVATVTGFAPATITYNLFGVGTINLETGNGNDTINDLGDTRGSNIYNGGGTDAVIVGNTTTGMQNITSYVSLHNAGGPSTLAVTDAGDTTARTVNVNYISGTGSVGGFTPFSAGVTWTSDALVPSTPVSILTGSGADTINVVGCNVPLSLSSTDGADVANIGNSTNSLNGILGSISITNPPNYTTFNIDDTANAAGRNWTFGSDGTNGTISISPTVTISYRLADAIPGTINLSNGVDNVRVTGWDTRPVTLNGNNGNDVFTLGSTANTVDPLNAAIGINGGAGTDSIILLNSGDTTESGFTMTGGTVTESDMAALSLAQDESLELRGGTGSAPIHTFTDTQSGVFLKLVPGASHDVVRVTNNSNLLTIEPSLGLDDVSVNDGSSASGARVAFDNSIKLGALTIKSLGTASATGTNMYLSATSLSMTGNAVLDLYANDMILDYPSASQLSAIQLLINSGRAAGAWTGAGITSTAAKNNPKHNTTLGAMEATEYKGISPSYTTFDGQPIDNTAVVIKYTYYGDANFNGKVDGGDYSRLDFGFSQHLHGWLNGDFNGDGSVNGSDYSLTDFSFGTQTGAINPPASLPQFGGGGTGALATR